ncbi:TLR adapter interacting with SLC15A4 on the lysosome [Pelodytes ibericus]
MLSEGYLYRIQHWYEDDISHHQKKITGSSKELTGVCGVDYSFAHDTRTRKFFNKCASGRKYGSAGQYTEPDLSKMQRQMRNHDTENVAIERETSPSLAIAGTSSSNKDTYLVPSSCKNICMDYNDLHVAGDQVMAMNSGLSDYTCNSSFEFCEGPFLESCQIPPTMESISVVTDDISKRPAKRETSLWKVGSLRDKSIIQHEQPLSNSILNEYLERKVIELYKQYIMDCSSSVDHIVTSELVMSNVQQISMQLSREQNMETNKAKDMVLNYLLRLASEKQSVAISTPDLQISKD